MPDDLDCFPAVAALPELVEGISAGVDDVGSSVHEFVEFVRFAATDEHAVLDAVSVCL